MRQLKSINVKVRCAASSELGTLIVDFLCSQSVVRLLPYRDTTQRKVCGQREEKRRSDDTHFSSLSLSTAESVEELSSVESYQDKFLSVSQCVYTVIIKKVWLLVRVFCALSKNVNYIKKKSKQRRA